ncbi:MAG: transcriptional regulator [Firmicutes bacterium]|nr:transcriptional regulator [Bacillota bacterium]
MDIIRIGDKVVSRERIVHAIDRILELRASGLPQQEVAARMAIDRAFVSKVESMGEVRRGGRVALIGFPVGNKEELRRVASSEGVDLILLMNDEERWDFVRGKSGDVLLNEIMGLIAEAKNYDVVVFIGSDMRIKLAEALLGPKVVGIELGISPIKEDKYVDPNMLRDTIRSLRV